jgi:hypothetical protein
MCTSPIGTYPLGMILDIKNFSLHGIISHWDHSNVNHISSLILSNACIKPLIYHPIAPRHYNDLLYKVEEKDKIPYWDNIHKRRKVSRGYHPSHVTRGDVVKGCPYIQVERKTGVILPVGAFVESELYPSWMQFFPRPLLPLFFIFFIFFFLFISRTS